MLLGAWPSFPVGSWHKGYGAQNGQVWSSGNKGQDQEARSQEAGHGEEGLGLVGSLGSLYTTNGKALRGRGEVGGWEGERAALQA